MIVYIQTKVHFEDGYGTVSGYFRRCCGEDAVTYFPLAGVTTNPSIIAAGKTAGGCASATSRGDGRSGASICPVMATTAEGMVNDARKLRSIIADIVVKVPVTAEGLAAIKMLKSEGIPTLGTAVYGAAQGLLSALAGAEYVAPYVNRIDAQGGSGIQTVTDLHQLLKMHAPQAKVLAASFKTRVRRWTAYWQGVNQLLCHWMWHNR